MLSKIITGLKNGYINEGVIGILKKITINEYTYKTSLDIRLNMMLRNDKFHLNHKKFSWCYDRHAWLHERAVEISVVVSIIQKHLKNNILEVGRVLPHYYRFQHDIIDKYEKDADTVNIDCIDYNTEQKYDLIVAISTLEHIGFDEFRYTNDKTTEENNKFIDVLYHLKDNLLSETGKIVITMPLGYNKNVDKFLKGDLEYFTETYFIRKMKCGWNEITQENSIGSKYDPSDPMGRTLFIGIYNSSGKKVIK